MARLVSEGAPAAEDPMRGVHRAIDKLVQVISQQQAHPVAPPPPAPTIEFPPAEPKPIRLEAEVVRDKTGKMVKVVVTPIYY